MSNHTIVTVRPVDDTMSPGPPLGRASLVTPLLVVLALPAAEPLPAGARLRVEVAGPDGTTQDVGVREFTVRPVVGADAALVGLVLDEPAAARPDVTDVGAVPVDDTEALEAAVWEHLTGDRPRTVGTRADRVGTRTAGAAADLAGPAGSDELSDSGGEGGWLSLFCRLFGIGCPPANR